MVGVSQKHRCCQRCLVNLQPFFYGRCEISASAEAAHEKDKCKTVKRCMGLIRQQALQKVQAGYNPTGTIGGDTCKGRMLLKPFDVL